MKWFGILICVLIIISVLSIVPKYFEIKNEIKRLKNINTSLMVENKELKSKILILKNKIKKAENSLKKLYD